MIPIRSSNACGPNFRSDGPSEMKYQVTQYSLRGGRPSNQDRVTVAERDNAVLMAVADGLGGHAGGELAAESFVQTAVHAFRNVKQPTIERPSAFLALVIRHAHNVIRAMARSHPMEIEPRTTCVLCIVQNGYAYWAHVGDSRLYHLRGTQVLARTQDHTSLEQWREEGLVTEAEMGEHFSKGKLLRCLGSAREPAIDIGQETSLQRGDTLLLCSDGLWEALSTEEIARYANSPALEEGIEDMLLAVERKRKAASDNVSVVALRWDDAMSKTLPLQGNPAGQVAPSALVREGARAVAGRKPSALGGKATSPSQKQESPNDSLDQRIEELEKYLSRFEPRPKRDNS